MPQSPTTYMGLVLPTPGGTDPNYDLGPAYARTENAALNTVDSHNHTPGKGAPVPTAGLNINADLPFGGNQATSVGGVVLATGTSDKNTQWTLYAKNNDLYFTDGAGNKIALTANGQATGPTGNITGLSSPASASYDGTSGTFTWQQNSGTSQAAAMDTGPVTIRDTAGSAKGIKVKSPTGLVSDYSITLPPGTPPGLLPGILLSDGSCVTSWGSLDQTTLVASGGILSVGLVFEANIVTGAVSTNKIAAGAVTAAKIAANAGIAGSQLADHTITRTQVAAPTATAITAASGWSTSDAGFWIDASGTVHLKGSVQRSTGGSTAFSLPAGALPTSTRAYLVAFPGNGSTASAVLTIAAASGSPATSAVTITLPGGSSVGTGSPIYLDGVSFLQEA